MWIRRRFADLAQLVASSRAAGRSVPATLPRFLHLLFAERYSPAEVFMLGLLRDGGPVDERRFISKERMLAAQLRANPRDRFPLTEDKLVFYRHCREHGLATPAVRAALCWSACDAGDVPVVRDAAALSEALAPFAPCDLVLKPVDGVHGHGVQILHLGNGVFESPEGRRRTAEALVADLGGSEYRNWLIQDRLHPHPDLAALSGSRYLQTARVVSLVERDGRVTLPAAWLRIIGGQGIFDNFNFGASGNLVGTLDLDAARIAHVFAPGPSGAGIVEIARHPRTGIAFAAFAVPYAAEIRELVERAARAFAPLRTIGWDVAITDSGPSLIEGNVTWDPLPTTGDLRRVAAAL
jgi:hypothetical protein